MPDYLPVVTTTTDPIISAVTGGDVSYEQIQQSIGTYSFQLQSLYISCPANINQLLRPIYLRKYNKQGDRNERSLMLTIDPFQLVGALIQDFEELDYRFDSNNFFYMDILANTSIQMVIKVQEMSPNEFFEDGEDSEGNMDEIEFLMGYRYEFDTDNFE